MVKAPHHTGDSLHKLRWQHSEASVVKQRSLISSISGHKYGQVRTAYNKLATRSLNLCYWTQRVDPIFFIASRLFIIATRRIILNVYVSRAARIIFEKYVTHMLLLAMKLLMRRVVQY